MTERQQSALDRLKRGINDIWFATLYSQEEMDEDISIVLDLVSEMQTEISKKNYEIKRIKKDNYELDRDAQKYFDAYMDGVSEIYGKNMEIDILVEKLYCYLKFMKYHNLTLDKECKIYNDKDKESMKYLKKKVEKKVEMYRNDGLYE